MKPSRASAARPSFYLLACSLLLLAGGVTSLLGSAANEAGDEAMLLARGWRALDAALPCPPATGYFELESDDESFEAYRAPSGAVVASRASTGGDSYRCRAVSGPHFIQEIP